MVVYMMSMRYVVIAGRRIGRRHERINVAIMICNTKVSTADATA
jgi:hypothetical protein